jgi:hypothetical protein
MMADMGANDVMKEMSVNETKVPVDRGCGSASECPGLVAVVR